MEIEVVFFLLRMLAALSLAAFLLALFVIIWRSLNQADRQLHLQRKFYGYLIATDDSSADSAANSGRFALEPITTLGRFASNSIVVNDDFASAEHAQIVLKDGQWWLDDRGSRNGTRLNGDLIQGPTILSDGDLIGIGRYAYKLDLAH